MNHSDIVNKIPERFDRALKAGDLLFFPSTTTKHIESNIEVKCLIKVSAIISDHRYLQYEIRLCPALQQKPTVSTPKDAGLAIHGNRGKVLDPFAPPYNTNLYVGEMKDDESEEEFVVLVRTS